jgi:hypothetical protein
LSFTHSNPRFVPPYSRTFLYVFILQLFQYQRFFISAAANIFEKHPRLKPISFLYYIGLRKYCTLMFISSYLYLKQYESDRTNKSNVYNEYILIQKRWTICDAKTHSRCKTYQVDMHRKMSTWLIVYDMLRKTSTRVRFALPTFCVTDVTLHSFVKKYIEFEILKH